MDDNTVRFELTRPESPFLADLAMDFASILSAEYADAMMKAGTPEKIDLEPLGTGPFQLVQYQKDSKSSTNRSKITGDLSQNRSLSLLHYAGCIRALCQTAKE